MAWTTAISPAKVNLFLETGARRADGYHDLDTIMVLITLCDRISFRLREDSTVHLHIRQQVPGDLAAGPDNLVMRAVRLLEEETGRAFGLDIVLDKQIPVQSGLGGGSSNATTTLVTLNRLLRLGLKELSLRHLASRLGSDQVFFFSRSAARCTGRGEQVHELSSFQRLWLVVGSPPDGLGTAQVFQALDTSRINHDEKAPDSFQFVHGWGSLGAADLGGRLFNRLQPIARTLSPWVDHLLKEFRRSGCCGCLMTGSGSSCFGIYPHRAAAVCAVRRLSSRNAAIRFRFATTLAGPVRCTIAA